MAQSSSSDWTLTNAHLSSRPFNWSSISNDGIQTAGGIIPWDDVVEIRQARPPNSSTLPHGWRLLLSDGDRLMGQPAGISGENLSWDGQLLGKLTIPLRLISGMDAAVSDVAPPQASHPMEDQASLANGDLVKGIVANVTDQTLSMQVNGRNVSIPLDALDHLRLAATSNAPPLTQRAFRLHLDDGSIVTAAAVQSHAEQLAAVLLDGSRHTFDLSHLTVLEQLNGPVLWLSSLTPVQSIAKSQFGLSWPARMNRSVTGEPIRFDQTAYGHGIGVHAYSKLVFTLPEGYRTFRTQYAIDGLGRYADVTVRIYLDDKPAYERTDVHAGWLSPVITLPIKSARTLALEVDFGHNGAVQDRFNWIEAALLRAAPSSQPAQ